MQSVLGYRFRPANPAQLILQRIGSTKPGSWLFQRTLYRIDRPLYQWSNGGVTLPGPLTGLPVVMLTTTGAKSGLSRTMPVAGIPFGEDLLVMGTNYAQGSTPGWVFNLEKDPRALVAWRGRSARAIATRLPAERMEEAWHAAARVFVGFPKYRKRIDDTREVRAFVLTPASSD